MARTGKPTVIAHRNNGEAINHLITKLYVQPTVWGEIWPQSLLAGRSVRITQDEDQNGAVLEVAFVNGFGQWVPLGRDAFAEAHAIVDRYLAYEAAF
jgi:hypothetical protein